MDASIDPSIILPETEQERKFYENDYLTLFSADPIPDAGLTATLPVLVVTSMIDELMNKGTELILNHLMQTKMRSHVKSNYDWLMNAVLDCELLNFENQPMEHPVDIEPPLEPIDNWGRYHVSLQTKTEPEQQPMIEWQRAKLKVGPLVVDEKNSIARAREKAKKHLKEIEKTEVPCAVDLKEEEMRDMLEERLRDEKQRKIYKLMQEETDRQTKERELQASLKAKNIQFDKTKKTYTYDFDGKIILTRQVKQESLPPNTYVLDIREGRERIALASKKVAVAKVEDSQPKKEEKDILFLMAQKPTNSNKGKAVTDDRELAKQFRTYRDPIQWDSFKITPGVALKEGGRLKEGPDFVGTFVTDPGDGKLRITKEEYNAKMRSAVINKDGLRLDASSSLHKKTESLDTSSPLFLQKSPQTKARGKFSFLPPLDTSESKPEVRIHSSKLLELMTKPTETMPQNSPYTALTDRPMHSTKNGLTSSEDQSLRINRNDEFNMRILQSSDWGKQVSVNVATQNPQPFPRLSRNAMKASVGLKIKTPRDRDIRQGYFLNTHNPLRSARESRAQNLFE